MIPALDKSHYFRILLIVILAVLTAGLYSLNRSRYAGRPPTIRQNPVIAVAEIDREVDTVLAHFNIAPEWIKKMIGPKQGTDIQRIERRVLLPLHILPIEMNIAFNAMAKRYGGRAIASENTKENTVTIHLEMDGTILQTIVLKPASELPETAQRISPKRRR